MDFEEVKRVQKTLARIFYDRFIVARLEKEKALAGNFKAANDLPYFDNKRHTETLAELRGVSSDVFLQAFNYFGPGAVLQLAEMFGGMISNGDFNSMHLALIQLGDNSLRTKDAGIILNSLPEREKNHPGNSLIKTVAARIRRGLESDDPDPYVISDTQDGFDADVTLGSICIRRYSKFCPRFFDEAFRLLDADARLKRAHGSKLLLVACRLLPENGYRSYSDEPPTHSQMIGNAITHYDQSGKTRELERLLQIKDQLQSAEIPDDPLFAAAVYDHLFEAKVEGILENDPLRNGRDVSELRKFGPG